MTNVHRTAVALALMLSVAACTPAGADDTQPPPEAPVEGPATGMCLEGTVDCVDAVFEPEVDVDGALVGARDLLGLSHEAVESRPGVRIGRLGDEHLALTEDYVIGRMTVGLDDDGTGSLIVTDVTIELPAGPQTIRD